MDAVRIIAAQPPERWETGARHIADELQVPASVIRAALKDMANAWNRDPRAAAQAAVRDINQVKARLARATLDGTAEVVRASPTTRIERAHLASQPLTPDHGMDR